MGARLPLVDELTSRLRFLVILAVPAVTLCAACATTYAPHLVEGQTARIDIIPAMLGESQNPGEQRDTFKVAVHDFANGCPLVEDHRTGKGYRGTITLKSDSPSSVVVPAGKRLALTSVWDSPVPFVFLFGLVGEALRESSQCVVVVSFVPEPRLVYVLRYGRLSPEGGVCGATVETVMSEADGKSTRLTPLASVAYPRRLRGDAAFQAGGLCALQP